MAQNGDFLPIAQKDQLNDLYLDQIQRQVDLSETPSICDNRIAKTFQTVNESALGQALKNGKPQCSRNFPKFSVLQKSLQNLRAAVPDMFSDEFVDQFYQKLYDRMYQASATKRVLPSKSQTIQILDRDISVVSQFQHKNRVISYPVLQLSLKPSDCKSQSKSTRPQNQKEYIQRNQADITKVQSQQSQQIIDQQDLIEIVKIVALVFCQIGYNIQAVQQKMFQRNLEVYQSQISVYKIASYIVSNAYEFLYQFLVNDCKKLYTSLAETFGQQFLINYLINCRRKMGPQICQIFYKIIKGQCSLGSQELTPYCAFKLYEQLEKNMTESFRKQQIFRSRKQENLRNEAGSPHQNNKLNHSETKLLSKVEETSISKHMQLKNKLTKIWNRRYESQLITAYKIGKTIPQMTEHMKEVFPDQQDNFSTIALRSQYYKMLRKSVRNFYRVLGRHRSQRFPEVKKLRHHQYKEIINNTEAFQVRANLLELLRSQGYDEKLMLKVIKEFNNYTNYMFALRNVSASKYTCQRAMKMIAGGKSFPNFTMAKTHI